MSICKLDEINILESRKANTTKLFLKEQET